MSVCSACCSSCRALERVGCFFFFSSRRRHTRYIGDWSSDVCSSDLRGVGQPPTVASHGLARDLMQADGPDVVAERVPELADVAGTGAGKVFERRIALEELVILRYDAIDLGLLEHDLGHEHAVGIARAPPGKIAAVPRVPGQQSALKCAHDARVWLDHARESSTPF